MSITLADRRRFYAEEIEAVASLRTHALVEALATVPREEFLPPGPWKIAVADPVRAGAASYRDTPDADPRHVYHNVLVALDPGRQLNNGHPSSLCGWIDALALAAGERVFHLGCGSGYYTALMAAVVGPSGAVVAAEVDPTLAGIARAGLARFGTVDVREGDGFQVDPGPVDVGLVNAGVTHLQPLWLDRLRPGGRLLVPITYAPPGARTGSGVMVLVRRADDGYRAQAVGSVAIYSAEGGRSRALNERMRAALSRLAQGGFQSLWSVRREPHEPDDSCWLHADGACLSMGESRQAAASAMN
jgi:protein-L-isoaspartate(D-aspartate) O-methyltransferase